MISSKIIIDCTFKKNLSKKFLSKQMQNQTNEIKFFVVAKFDISGGEDSNEKTPMKYLGIGTKTI